MPTLDASGGRIGKAEGHEPMMNDWWKSDRSVVPAKRPNKGERSPAEAVEERGLTKGNTTQQNMSRTQSRMDVPSALERVRQAAERDKNAKFTALFHHITVDRLRDAFGHLQKKAAPGVDGVGRVLDLHDVSLDRIMLRAGGR